MQEQADSVEDAEEGEAERPYYSQELLTMGQKAGMQDLTIGPVYSRCAMRS